MDYICRRILNSLIIYTSVLYNNLSYVSIFHVSINVNISFLVDIMLTMLNEQVKLLDEDVSRVPWYPNGIYLHSVNRTFGELTYNYDHDISHHTNMIMVCVEDFNPEWWREHTAVTAGQPWIAVNVWVLCFLFVVLHV